MRLYLYMCLCACVYFIYTCLFVFVGMRMYSYMYVHVFLYRCLPFYVSRCMCVFVYLCRLNASLWSNHLYARKCMCTYKCMWMCLKFPNILLMVDVRHSTIFVLHRWTRQEPQQKSSIVFFFRYAIHKELYLIDG